MSSRSASSLDADQTGRRAKPPQARAKVVPSLTHRGTTQRNIFYGCPHCGLIHRVIELGLRESACHRGLVLVVAGGA